MRPFCKKLIILSEWIALGCIWLQPLGFPRLVFMAHRCLVCGLLVAVCIAWSPLIFLVSLVDTKDAWTARKVSVLRYCLWKKYGRRCNLNLVISEIFVIADGEQMNNSVGVVLCTYNGIKFVEKQLESILNQTVVPDKIVISDDCSTDGTWQVLQRYKANNPNIILMHSKTNVGWIKNFATTIDYCTTDFIALADQDDVWFPNKLEICLDVLRSDATIGLCYHDAELIFEDGQSVGKTFWECASTLRYPLGKHEGRQIVENMGSPIPGFAMVFSSELKKYFFPFPGEKFCGHDWWLSAIGFTLFNPEGVAIPLGCHRIHPDQAVGDVAMRLKKCSGTRVPIITGVGVGRKIIREISRCFLKMKIGRERERDALVKKNEFSKALGILRGIEEKLLG